VTVYLNLIRPDRLVGLAREQSRPVNRALGTAVLQLFALLLICLVVWLQLAGPPERVAYLDLRQDAGAASETSPVLNPAEPEVAPLAPPVTAEAPQATAAANTPGTAAAPSVATATALQSPGNGLAPAPDPAIVRNTATGPLPMVASDGRSALRVYARPFAGPPGSPRIAIVVASLGLRETYSQAAIRTLPPDVTLAFTPYAGNLATWLATARSNGHETLMGVPMEPLGYPGNDPGPQTLLASLGTTENIRRLDWALSRAAGYVGVLPLMGSGFTANEKALKPVIEALKERGLMLLDTRASTQSLAGRISAAAGLPASAATLTLDSKPTREAVEQRLADLERAARARGSAVGITFEGAPVVLEAISAWAAGLGQRGIVLAPISALASRAGP